MALLNNWCLQASGNTMCVCNELRVLGHLFASIPRAFAKRVRWQGLLAAEWLLAHSPVGVVLPSAWHVL
jgi:hypothetical protein